MGGYNLFVFFIFIYLFFQIHTLEKEHTDFDCVFFTQDPSIKFFWANIIRLWILLILKADPPPPEKILAVCSFHLFNLYYLLRNDLL